MRAPLLATLLAASAALAQLSPPSGAVPGGTVQLGTGCLIANAGGTPVASVSCPMRADGGVYVPDLGNFGPGQFPGGNLGLGTYLGRDLYMQNSSPQVSWFQSALQGNVPTGACDAGYNIFESTSGVLEVNTICPSGAGPGTLCEWNFYPPGGLGSVPFYQCVGPIGGGDAFGDVTTITGKALTIFAAASATDTKNWWWQVTGSGATLDMRYVNDAASSAGLGFRLTRSGANPAGWTFYQSDSATTELGGDGSGNLTAPGTLTLSGFRVPQTLHGSDAGTAGALSVHFSPSFSAVPDCTCSVQGGLLACEVVSRSVSNAQFTDSTGTTDVINWICAN